MRQSICIAAVLILALTPAFSETLLTESQALKILFPKATSVEARSVALSEPQRDSLERKTGLHFREPAYRSFVAHGEHGIEGYAVIMNEIGKHEYITFIVGVTPKGQVSDVLVMEYRESRGGEVSEKRFLSQFRGKKAEDPIQVDHDIINYTGATLSSHAIARGVKKALALVQMFYLQLGAEGR
jgi:Na+-translocating ferredoxin:NAD+ oxidoreductase RnfG subunit